MTIIRKLAAALIPSTPLERLLVKVRLVALEHALKEATACNARMSDELVKTREEVTSLRRGSTAGFHEAAAAALEEVIDECRELLGISEESIPLPKAITRRLERSSAEVQKALEGERNAVAKLRKLEEVLATSERLGGVNGAARLILHCGDREPLSSAASRVMGELEAALAKVAELEGALVTANMRKTELDGEVARLTSELALERTDLEALEDATGLDAVDVADRSEEVGLSAVLTELRIAEAEARRERDEVALDRDAKGRELVTLKAKIADLGVAAGRGMGETLEAAIERLRDAAERAA